MLIGLLSAFGSSRSVYRSQGIDNAPRLFEGMEHVVHGFAPPNPERAERPRLGTEERTSWVTTTKAGFDERRMLRLVGVEAVLELPISVTRAVERRG